VPLAIIAEALMRFWMAKGLCLGSRSCCFSFKQASETMFGIGATELLIVAFIAWMLFGKRLPYVARRIGQSVTASIQELKNIKDDIHERPV
jgi:hypothetical protein